jgi:phosphatidylglycerol:prolipoprotein diacylglycerol transferase
MPAYISFPSWIHPQIVSFLPVRWYGLMYLVAFAITYLLFRWQLRDRGIEAGKDRVLDMFFWAIVGLLVGARAGDVIIYSPSLLKNPLQIILPIAWVDGKLRFTGIQGMSYHGGLVGATVAIVTYLKVKKLDVLDWGDMMVAGIPLGYTFGRLGNFINGELYGRITRVPWGMVFPNAAANGEIFPASQEWVKGFAGSVGMPVPATGLVNLPRHPSQLYEAFFEGVVLWLILWFIVRKRRPYKGFVIACYVLGYGVIRFFIEYARQPDKGIGYRGYGYPIILQPLSNYLAQSSWFNFSTGQILCFLMIVAALIMMAAFRAWSRRTGTAGPEAPRPLSARKLRKKVK